MLQSLYFVVFLGQSKTPKNTHTHTHTHTHTDTHTHTTKKKRDVIQQVLLPPQLSLLTTYHCNPVHHAPSTKPEQPQHAASDPALAGGRSPAKATPAPLGDQATSCKVFRGLEHSQTNRQHPIILPAHPSLGGRPGSWASEHSRISRAL